MPPLKYQACSDPCTGAVAILESTSVFGRGIGPFVLDDVECSGAESSLSECSHPGFRVHNCFRYQEAGVSCREGTHPPKEKTFSIHTKWGFIVPVCFMGTIIQSGVL